MKSAPIPLGADPQFWGTLGTIAIVLVADQASKTLAFFVGGNDSWLFPILNDDTAWELFHLPPFQLVVVVSAVAAAAGRLGWWLVAGGRMSPIVLGLLLGGSLGNICDRVALGAVRDYLAIPQFGIFNLADLAIAIGGLTWAVSVARTHPHNQLRL